ncbi:MAG: N-6 DNA methylase [Sporichthyaceae bacterium]
MTRQALGEFLAACRRRCIGIEATDDPRRLATLAGVAAALGCPSDAALLAYLDGAAVPVPPGGGPDVLVAACEVTQPRSGRRSAGSFYTPPHVATAIAREVLSRVEVAQPSVCDPAAGAGAFLLAAGRVLTERGVPARTVVEECLTGADLDQVALLCADAALRIFAPEARRTNLLRGDALLDVDWEAIAPAGFDAVLGNPPFLNQLETATVRGDATAMRARFGSLAAGYADTAAVFLALALDLTRDGGTFGLILPESTLATRDARAVRAHVAEVANLAWIWRSVDNVFEAGVQVCAPVFVRGPAPPLVERATGADLVPIDPIEVRDLASRPTWSSLFADARGIPTLELSAAGTLADWCTATADFRDQYYGLVPHVREASDDLTKHQRKLVTVGLVDPARLLWGTRRTRFAKTAYERPVVDLRSLATDEALSAWARARLVPKLLLSTQTRVLEVLADPEGVLVPSIPNITIVCAEPNLWHVGAALSSPVLTAWALRHFAGAALSTDAIKLSAKQVLALPAPAPGPAWDRGAEAYRAACAATSGEDWSAALGNLGAHMCAAYGLSETADLLAWWSDRLPAWAAPQISGRPNSRDAGTTVVRTPRGVGGTATSGSPPAGRRRRTSGR